MKTQVLLISLSLSWDHVLMLWTRSQERDRNTSEVCVFFFHHSIQLDEVSGYTFYNKTNINISKLRHQLLLKNCTHVRMRLNLDLQDWLRDIGIKLCLVIALVLIGFVLAPETSIRQSIVQKLALLLGSSIVGFS